jgi:hypothetical protein
MSRPPGVRKERAHSSFRPPRQPPLTDRAGCARRAHLQPRSASARESPRLRRRRSPGVGVGTANTAITGQHVWHAVFDRAVLTIPVRGATQRDHRAPWGTAEGVARGYLKTGCPGESGACQNHFEGSVEHDSPSLLRAIEDAAVASCSAVRAPASTLPAKLQLKSRTPAASRGATMRKSSCLISCSQPGPTGGVLASDGRQSSQR